MRKLLLKLCIVFLFFVFTNTRAQTSFSHEVGVNLGIASFQPDFGLSTDFQSANQANLAYGLSYYLKFFGSQYNWRSGSSFFSEHFKVRVDFSYTNNTNVNNDAFKDEPSYEEKFETQQAQIDELQAMIEVLQVK